jgi:hypothetical protein
MVKRKKVKVSYTKKLAWLRKRHIIVKKGKVAKTTVNRLYTKFKIQKMPLSTPRDVAMGMGKRLERKILKYGAKAKIRTPKGTITGKQYVKTCVKEIDEIIRLKLPADVEYKPNIYYRNVQKVQDHITHHFNPKEYNAVKYASGRTNILSVMNRAIKNIFPIIQKDIILINNFKGKYYKTLWVNIKMHFKMVDANGIVSDHFKYVPFSDVRASSMDNFLTWYFYKKKDEKGQEQSVENVMKEGFLLCKTDSGEAGSHLVSITLYFSTDKRASEYDKLRASHTHRIKKL